MLTAAMATLLFTSCSDDDEQEPGTIGISTAEETYEEGAGEVAVAITTTDAYDMDV